MHIPSPHRHRRATETLGPVSHPNTHPGGGIHQHWPEAIPAWCRLGLVSLFQSFFIGIGRENQGEDQGMLQRRQFSDNPSKNQNIKIGVIVGILLAAFIAAVAAFLYIYGRSIRFTERKRRRRNHRHKYYSSRSSRSSDGPPPPRPPRSSGPPPPPPAHGAPLPKDLPADG
ncbi:hypothetical protein BGZ63DRAFT_427649 [Mariannaea sp. PMI_226]|nr:hypothetical protein BGZ63DRAFT_427649 [Mariannaea sp. PMI_226]